MISQCHRQGIAFQHEYVIDTFEDIIVGVLYHMIKSHMYFNSTKNILFYVSAVGDENQIYGQLKPKIFK